MDAGYLSLHLGPMRAGKSCYATRKATEYADIGERVVYITYYIGERNTSGGQRDVFSSHSSSNVYLTNKVTALATKLLSSIDVRPYAVVVIDEAQFYEDVVETVLRWVDSLHKRVVVIGLDSSFKRGRIGSVIDLVHHADYYEKLLAKCEMCYRENKDAPLSSRLVDAPFTVRIGDDDSLISIGNEEYVPVCRYHYNYSNNK